MPFTPAALVVAVATGLFVGAAVAADPGVLKSEFIYDRAPFPS